MIQTNTPTNNCFSQFFVVSTIFCENKFKVRIKLKQILAFVGHSYILYYEIF